MIYMKMLINNYINKTRNYQCNMYPEQPKEKDLFVQKRLYEK